MFECGPDTSNEVNSVVSKQCNEQKRVETSRKRVETSRNEQKRVGNEQKRIGNEQKFRKRVKLSTQQVFLLVLVFLHWGLRPPNPPYHNVKVATLIAMVSYKGGLAFFVCLIHLPVSTRFYALHYLLTTVFTSIEVSGPHSNI